jgi:eukaryotic-like serine/threonine-protein kinase
VAPIDEDPPAPGATPQVLTVGSPQVGEVLAERYKLDRHIGNDTLGRQLWRGSDVILQRPVTVVLRYPGGESAAEMLSAAVTASRIVHPHLVGVYDAIDEGDRAYVVREWVEGTSLRHVVHEYGPLEADKAVAIGHAIADAVAALHATGMAHGNVQPGTVLIGDDGRVVLADARSDESATVQADVRAVGAVLYCCLTGHWPHTEAGAMPEPDALRDGEGVMAAPTSVRAGVPEQVDQLTTALLDPQVRPPTATEVTSELARLDAAAEDHRALFADEPLDLETFESASGDPESSTATGRKMAIVIAALLVIAIAGTIAAARTLGGSGTGSGSTPQAGASGSAGAGRPSAGEAAPIKLTADQIRIVDPAGNGTERNGSEKMIDGNTKTFWHTDRYEKRPDFGGIKPGMGVLIDLGKDTSVTSVELELNNSGATVELRAVSADPGATNEGDNAIIRDFAPDRLVGETMTNAPTRVVLGGQPDSKIRYVLVWFTKLPPDDSGGFRVAIKELRVTGQ